MFQTFIWPKAHIESLWMQLTSAKLSLKIVKKYQKCNVCNQYLLREKYNVVEIFYSGADLLFEQNDNFYNQYEGNSIFVSTKPKQMNIR